MATTQYKLSTGHTLEDYGADNAGWGGRYGIAGLGRFNDAAGMASIKSSAGFDDATWGKLSGEIGGHISSLAPQQPAASAPAQTNAQTQPAPSLTQMAQNLPTPTAPAQTTPSQNVAGTTYYNAPNGGSTTTPPATQPMTAQAASTQPAVGTVSGSAPLSWQSYQGKQLANLDGGNSILKNSANGYTSYTYNYKDAQGNTQQADISNQDAFNKAGIKGTTWEQLTGKGQPQTYAEGGKTYNLANLTPEQIAANRANAAKGIYSMADGGTFDWNQTKAQMGGNVGAGTLAPQEVAPGYYAGAQYYTMGQGQQAYQKAAPTNPLYANNPTGSPVVAAQQAAANPTLAGMMAQEQRAASVTGVQAGLQTPVEKAQTQEQAAVNSGQKQAGANVDQATETRLNDLIKSGDQTEYNRILDYLVQSGAMDKATADQRKAGSAAAFAQQTPTPTIGGFKVQGGPEAGGQQPTWQSVGQGIGSAMTDLSGGLTNIMNLLAKQTGQPVPSIPTAGTGVNGYAPRPGSSDPSVGSNGVWTTKDGQQFTLNDASITYMKQTGQIPADWQPPAQPGTQYANQTATSGGITVPPAWKGMDDKYRATYQQMLAEGWTPEQINSNQGQTIIGGRMNRGDNVAERTVLNEQQMAAVTPPTALDSILKNPNQQSYDPKEAATVGTLAQMQATPPAANPGGSAQPGSTTPTAAQPGSVPGTANPQPGSVSPGGSTNVANPGATFYPGQQNYAQNQQTLLGLLGAYGGQTANAFNNRANPYGEGNPALEGRNAASVANAREQTANAAEQARRNRVATGMDTSGLSAADRRNVELAGAATLSSMLNQNRVEDYDKGANWDTQNRQLGMQADNTHISQIMAMNSNDRANFSAGQQKDQFDQQLAYDKELKAAMFDQSFWNGILGGVGKLTGGVAEWATSPKGMQTIADLAQKSGQTFDAVKNALLTAMGLGSAGAIASQTGYKGDPMADMSGQSITAPAGGQPASVNPGGGASLADISRQNPGADPMGNYSNQVINPTPAEGTQQAPLPGQSKGVWENISDGLSWFFGGVWNTLTTGSPDGHKSPSPTGGASYDPSIPGPPGHSGFGTQSLTRMSQNGPQPQPIMPTPDMSFEQWVAVNAKQFKTTPENFIMAVHAMAQKAGA